MSPPPAFFCFVQLLPLTFSFTLYSYLTQVNFSAWHHNMHLCFCVLVYPRNLYNTQKLYVHVATFSIWTFSAKQIKHPWVDITCEFYKQIFSYFAPLSNRMLHMTKKRGWVVVLEWVSSFLDWKRCVYRAMCHLYEIHNHSKQVI